MQLPDLIRMNQLVRGEIDFPGFQSWFDESPNDARRRLLHKLSEFAYQAGVDRAVFKAAVVASGLGGRDATVSQVRSLQKNDGLASWRMSQSIESLEDEELQQHLRFLVALFGSAEGRVFRNEQDDWCNHWWHRDLLDDRVVQDLLADPDYFRTSMKDDARVKS